MTTDDGSFRLPAGTERCLRFSVLSQGKTSSIVCATFIKFVTFLAEYYKETKHIFVVDLMDPMFDLCSGFVF